MILYLDVISPVPKFVIIDNNKVIESLHILEKSSIKLSDYIHKKFKIIESKYNLLNLLNYLVVSTGPGSFTSLRVGISFMLGLSYSKKIPICGISCAELNSQFVLKKDFSNTLVIICSSNNQNFILFPNNIKNYQYKMFKISDNHSFNEINLKLYSKCVSNYKLPSFINKVVASKINKIDYVNFEDKLNLKYLNKIRRQNIIEPIYLSDNKLLNIN